MASHGYSYNLQFQCKAAKLPAPVLEYRFHPSRKWRFDLAWPDRKLAAEVDGGIWVGGRHNRGRGFEADMVKMNAGAVLGWRVLRFSVGMVKSGEALNTLQECLSEQAEMPLHICRQPGFDLVLHRCLGCAEGEARKRA